MKNKGCSQVGGCYLQLLVSYSGGSVFSPARSCALQGLRVVMYRSGLGAAHECVWLTLTLTTRKGLTHPIASIDHCILLSPNFFPLEITWIKWSSLMLKYPILLNIKICQECSGGKSQKARQTAVQRHAFTKSWLKITVILGCHSLISTLWFLVMFHRKSHCVSSSALSISLMLLV